MHRALPVGNKILTKRWQDRDKEIHKRKLRDVKPSIDSRCPVRFRHISKKAKKEQILEGI